MAVSTCSRGIGGREGTSVGPAETPGESCEPGEVGEGGRESIRGNFPAQYFIV